jgi:hypothetical protein
MKTHAILVHGLGRTSLSMRYLAMHLRKAGVQPHCFGYYAAFESFGSCVTRLQHFIELQAGRESFIVIGHSLGSVLLRSVIPKLSHPPLGCFFLAPPTKSCRAAQFLQKNFLFRVMTGNMGQFLSDDGFMTNLPVPDMPTVIYVGTAGPKGRWSPFQNEENDGILAVSETAFPTGRIKYVKALHTFIMNSGHVIRDIIATLEQMTKSAVT